MSRRTQVRFGISALVFALFLLHTARIVPLRLLDVVEAFTYDARVVLTLPHRADPKIVIVDLDEKSLAAEGQWPWTRDRLATLVGNLFDRYHRSEEHTSELQPLMRSSYAVFCLKKKN